jgi:hypothetical protein
MRAGHNQFFPEKVEISKQFETQLVGALLVTTGLGEGGWGLATQKTNNW